MFKILNKLKCAFYQNSSNTIKCSDVFSSNGDNNYDALKKYKNKIGIYRFFCIKDGTDVTLYIGESHKTTHGLKDRVTQNFRINDTGGTFRKNLAQELFNNNEKEALNYIKEHIFIQFIILDPIIYTESQIHILEQIAIDLFAPQYNLKKRHNI